MHYYYYNCLLLLLEFASYYDLLLYFDYIIFATVRIATSYVHTYPFLLSSSVFKQ